MKLDKHIILIGFMGTGKTTIGAQLSAKINCSFFDTDNEVVEAEKMSIDKLFAEHGEEYFRSAETKVLSKLINNSPSVIATGGGIILKPINREIIGSQHVVLLEASPDEIYRRVGDSSERPLIKGNAKEKIDTLLMERTELYKALADITILTNSKSVEQIIDEIMAYLHLY